MCFQQSLASNCACSQTSLASWLDPELSSWGPGPSIFDTNGSLQNIASSRSLFILVPVGDIQKWAPIQGFGITLICPETEYGTAPRHRYARSQLISSEVRSSQRDSVRDCMADAACAWHA